MIRLIGIAGRKGHGKDTAALGLKGYTNVKFAQPLKDMLRTFMGYIGLPSSAVEIIVEGELKEMPLEFFGGHSARHAMQTLGTEWGRALICDDIWIKAFESRVRGLGHFVCTDMRFPNEVNIIKALGGTTVRVHNPRLEVSSDQHPSEALIDNLVVDHQINNDGSIQDLQQALRRIADPLNHDDATLERHGQRQRQKTCVDRAPTNRIT